MKDTVSNDGITNNTDYIIKSNLRMVYDKNGKPIHPDGTTEQCEYQQRVDYIKAYQNKNMVEIEREDIIMLYNKIQELEKYFTFDYPEY